MNNFAIQTLQPFGAVVVDTTGHGDLQSIAQDQIFEWLREYKVLVFRGFEIMPKQDFALYGQQLGEPLQWPFGAINDLKVKPDAENYIFTDHAVPLHWDGAFAGKIPHVILFQCIVAPDKADLGGTTFVDTAGILAQATPAQLAAWQQIEITYSTEKIVHYGGKIHQKLVAPHVVDQVPVMRFAEPVDDLNPVKLEVHGLQGQTQADFISELQGLMYDPTHMYVHRWESGDIAMADNHLLLHGREAFKNPHERYIQRINVLHRPKPSFLRMLKHSMTIRRKEFFVAELPIFLIPLLLCVQSWADLAQPALWIGLAALTLLFNIGDIINCLTDYELDAIYKSHLSNAVYELGKRNVKIQMAVSVILALALTVWASVLSDRLYLVPVTILGLLIGLQYSAKPFKFKSRGLWQLLCLWGIIFFGPMGYAAVVVNGLPSGLLWGIFAAYGIHQMGIIMLNTAEDYTEDKAAGLRTSIIYLGLHRAMRLAFAMVVIAGLALQVLFAIRFWELEAASFWEASILIFTVGWAKICWEYWAILQKMQGKNEEDATKVLKKNGMKVPEWLKIGAYTTLAVVVALFAKTVLKL